MDPEAQVVIDELWLRVQDLERQLAAVNPAKAEGDQRAAMNLVEASRGRDALFRRVADLVPVPIRMVDTSGRYSWFNRAWLEFTGRTIEQEEGGGWTEEIHPDDLEHCLQISTNAFEYRESFETEYRLRHHDGNWRWVLDHGIPLFGEANNFTGYLGSCVDVTERRKSEQALRESEARLRAIYDGTYEYIGLLSPDGVLLETNRASLEFSEYKRSDVVGLPFWETPWFALTPGAPERVREGVRRCALHSLLCAEGRRAMGNHGGG